MSTRQHIISGFIGVFMALVLLLHHQPLLAQDSRIDTLILQLESNSNTPRNRRHAAKALREMRSDAKKAIPNLVSAMGDRCGSWKRNLIYDALSKIGTPNRFQFESNL